MQKVAMDPMDLTTMSVRIGRAVGYDWVNTTGCRVFQAILRREVEPLQRGTMVALRLLHLA